MTLYNLRVTKFLGNVGTLKKNKRFKKSLNIINFLRVGFIAGLLYCWCKGVSNTQVFSVESKYTTDKKNKKTHTHNFGFDLTTTRSHANFINS